MTDNLFLSIVFITIYVYMLISSISVILLENRNPVRSLSWILVLILLPYLGLILYLLIGQNYRKQKILTKIISKNTNLQTQTELQPDQIKHFVHEKRQQQLINLLHRNSDSPVYANNKIDILSDGETTFDSMFEAISNAKDHIHIEFFIFEDDRISNKLRELLIIKAQSGIRVRMIYDYLGSFDLSAYYLKSLRQAGAYVKPFLPLRLRLRRSKINFRNHRKLLIVDGKVGYTGGLNFADRYIFGNTLGKWRDTFVRFEGPVVHGLQAVFVTDWHFVEKKLITNQKYFPEAKTFSENLVQVVSSGPDSDWESIMQGIALAIISAQKYVYIHTPYFVPTDVIMNAITIAAMGGTDVQLMIPSRSDSRLSDACTFSYLGELLDAGVKVFQYSEGFLHSKAIVIDDNLSIIGSANLDERSFNQNFEVNTFIFEDATAILLKNLYLNDLKYSKEITHNAWSNRTRRQKLKESFARLFSPII